MMCVSDPCACVQALKERELRAAPERIEKALELVVQQREREVELQERYKLLTREQEEAVAAGKA